MDNLIKEHIKILIAEDELDPQYIMAKRFAQEGFQVITAQDGREAIDKIRIESPDIIILDLMMPHVDGFGVLRYLRENVPPSRWQPVIIVSARRDLENFNEDFFFKSDYYISKPCKLGEVIGAVYFLLEQRFPDKMNLPAAKLRGIIVKS